MGLLDIFRGKGEGGRQVSWSLQRKIKKALNKYVPFQDRQAALQGLVEDGSDAAIRALIRRLTFLVEPLTIDEQEKRYVRDAILDLDARAVPFLVESIRASDSIMWQLGIYRTLVSEEELLASLLGLIEEFDTEYEKNPQRKIQIIESLGEWKSERVAQALARFLEDVDETVRYQTVHSLLRQEGDAVRDLLLDRMLSDESNRIRDLVIEGFADREISLKGYHARRQVEEKLPPGIVVDGKGVLRRKGPKTR